MVESKKGPMETQHHSTYLEDERKGGQHLNTTVSLKPAAVNKLDESLLTFPQNEVVNSNSPTSNAPS